MNTTTPCLWLLQLPALPQGPGQRDALRRAEGQARRHTAPEKGGEGSDNRTEKDATTGPSGSSPDLHPTHDLSGFKVCHFCCLPTVGAQ